MTLKKLFAACQNTTPNYSTSTGPHLPSTRKSARQKPSVIHYNFTFDGHARVLCDDNASEETIVTKNVENLTCPECVFMLLSELDCEPTYHWGNTLKKKAVKKSSKSTKFKRGRRLGIYIDGETSARFEKFCKEWEVPNTSAEVCEALNSFMSYHGRP